MADYLDGFLSIIPESQKDKLLATLNIDGNLSGKSDQEYEEAIRQLLGQLGKKEMTMQLRPQSERTNSEAYNQTLREILTDLHVLFQDSNNLDKAITNHHQLNISYMSQVQTDIERLGKRIDMLNLLADNTEGYMAASHDTFLNNDRMEPLRSNLYDNSIPDLVAIEYESIKLGTSVDKDRTATSVEMLEMTGEGFRNNTDHNIGKAMDTSPDSFWAEVILSDEPLRVPLGGRENGAICKFKITFPAPCAVSHIMFKPYTQYPLEIVSIGYTNDDTNNIVGFVELRGNTKIHSAQSYDFPSVLAKALVITIRQETAEVNDYLVTRDSLSNREMWQRIQDAEAANVVANTAWEAIDTNEDLDDIKEKVILTEYDHVPNNSLLR